MRKLLIVLLIIVMFSSCASLEQTEQRKQGNQNLEMGLWGPDFMAAQKKSPSRKFDRKKDEKIIINQKDANPKTYFFDAFQLGDSLIVVQCHFDNDDIDRVILWDQNQKITTFRNGYFFRFKPRKSDYYLRCSTFSKKSTEDFTVFKHVHVDSKNFSNEKIRNNMTDQFIPGDLRTFQDNPPQINFKRAGMTSKIIITVEDYGDNAGLKWITINNGDNLNLEEVKRYPRTIESEYLSIVEAEDIGGNKVEKRYKPFNTPYSKFGALSPFYNHGYGVFKLKLKTPFYIDWYDNELLFAQRIYGLEWKKIVFDTELNLSISKKDKMFDSNSSSNSIGGKATITGLWTSRGVHNINGLILGASFYSSSNKLGFNQQWQENDNPLFMDSNHSVFYNGDITLNDTLAYKMIKSSIIIGWKQELSKVFLVGASIAPSFSKQKGVWLSHGKNKGLEGKYYPSSKTLVFFGNETEFAKVFIIDNSSIGLNNLELKTFAELKAGDFTFIGNIYCIFKRLRNKNSQIKGYSAGFSATVRYRFWW